MVHVIEFIPVLKNLRGFIRGEVVNYDDLRAFYDTALQRGQSIEKGQFGLKSSLDCLRMEGLARSQGG